MRCARRRDAERREGARQHVAVVVVVVGCEPLVGGEHRVERRRRTRGPPAAGSPARAAPCPAGGAADLTPSSATRSASIPPCVDAQRLQPCPPRSSRTSAGTPRPAPRRAGAARRTPGRPSSRRRRAARTDRRRAGYGSARVRRGSGGPPSCSASREQRRRLQRGRRGAASRGCSGSVLRPRRRRAAPCRVCVGVEQVFGDARRGRTPTASRRGRRAPRGRPAGRAGPGSVKRGRRPSRIAWLTSCAITS